MCLVKSVGSGITSFGPEQDASSPRLGLTGAVIDVRYGLRHIRAGTFEETCRASYFLFGTAMDGLTDLLKRGRGIDLEPSSDVDQYRKTLSYLSNAADRLEASFHSREADILREVWEKCRTPTNFGGLGLDANQQLNDQQTKEVLFLCEVWLESLNSADAAKYRPPPITARPANRRGMTVAEKLLALHDVEHSGSVRPGQVIRVAVDWIMASELSWGGMLKTYDQLGKPGIFRNDRFWLAGDHVVDPRVNERPHIKRAIDDADDARDTFKMTEYQGLNYTIMHTEFFRERAEPGMLVIGSDSHTCSGGAASALAIGLGAPDVTMALVTGQTWFKVPETCRIRFTGRPAPGISGKDVILYILKELRRNTVAAERIVEFTGPGAQYLSGDARFAICNMCTEFGAITGLFVPDEVTYNLVNARKNPRYKSSSVYCRPDDDAEYAESHDINLDNVVPFVAKYPNPDDVVPVSDLAGGKLDGCFIGACTTAEEDIFLGALVLEQCFNAGKQPVKRGKRKVVPGSRPILDKLRSTGLAEVYEDAGFEVGIPGCSYCVGMSADVAGEGEVWLSSQNRNFENRMGKGSIGSITSAAAVAASSFDMEVTNPREYLSKIDMTRFEQLLSKPRLPAAGSKPKITYAEPPEAQEATSKEPTAVANEQEAPSESQKKEATEISGKIQRLGDFVDTDALAPAPYLAICKNNQEFGEHCMEFVKPDFRDRAANGFNVVVAGKAFGCGSSRAEAVMSLIGCGITCVIAKSYAFIYARNSPSLGLMSIVVTDTVFYELAQDGEEVEVSLQKGCVKVGGRSFRFEFSELERKLMDLGGIAQAFQRHGKGMFEALSKPNAARAGGARVFATSDGGGKVGAAAGDGKEKAGLEW